LPGYAITEVQIDGVLHEYTTIDGVQEDVVEILLNLKNVAINLKTREEAEFVISKKGPAVVTAGDIQVDHDAVTTAGPFLLITNSASSRVFRLIATFFKFRRISTTSS
jgi:DNA-directed RNA polymerase subunit alpha